jgi:hypothetical protein
MLILRGLAFWLCAGLLFWFYLLPDIASWMREKQQNREYEARLSRLREKDALANRIIEDEKQRERVQFEEVLEINVLSILRQLDANEAWLLDPPVEGAA